jgi:predicted thioesterase
MHVVPAGTAITRLLVVTDTDRSAPDEGEEAHDVIGVPALVGHALAVARCLAQVVCAEGESSSPAELSVRVQDPAAVGVEIAVTATVTESSEDALTAEVVVASAGGPSATVTVTHRRDG